MESSQRETHPTIITPHAKRRIFKSQPAIVRDLHTHTHTHIRPRTHSYGHICAVNPKILRRQVL